MVKSYSEAAVRQHNYERRKGMHNDTERCRYCSNTDETHVIENKLCGNCRDRLDQAGLLFKYDNDDLDAYEAMEQAEHKVTA